MSEWGPSRSEMQQLGIELIEALSPLREKYPGLDLVCCYSLPRPGTEDTHAVSVASTIHDLHRVLEVLVHVARDVHEAATGTRL